MRNVYKDKSEFVAPPCFHCGAPMVARWQEISANFEPVVYVVTQLECTKRCIETDPEGYKLSLSAHLKKEGL